MYGQILAYFCYIHLLYFKNKYFKIKYFYRLSNSSIIISKAIGFLSNAFLVDIKSAKPVEFISILIILVIGFAYLEGYLYQIFKNISYEKNKKFNR